MDNRNDRRQLRYTTIEDFVKPSAFVRVIDQFVECLDLEQIGFPKNVLHPATGRSTEFRASDLLKLLIFGAAYQYDSCRDLERACETNLEVIWLMQCGEPKRQTINDFRKTNVHLLKKVFEIFVNMVLREKGIGYQGIDGSKFKANNAKDANFTISKLDDRIKWRRENLKELERLIRKLNPDYVLPEEKVIPFPQPDAQKKKKAGKKVGEQLGFTLDEQEMIIDAVMDLFEASHEDDPDALIKGVDQQKPAGEVTIEYEEADQAKKDEKLQNLLDEVEKKMVMLGTHLGYREYMEKNGMTQLSLTDTAAKLMKSKNGYIVAYNIQAVVDSKLHMVSDFIITDNPGDCGQLYNSLKALKQRYPDQILNAIADKGYQSSDDMATCLENGILPHVIPDPGHDTYDLFFALRPCEIPDEDRKSTRAEALSKCLHAGVIPEAYADYLFNPELVSKAIYDTDLPNDVFSMTDDQLKQLASTGYFVRNLELDRVYCPSGEILRKKTVKKDGSIRYANKLSCKNCTARKAGYCTTSEWKEIDFPDKVTVKACKKWPDPEYEDTNETEQPAKSEETASPDVEKKEEDQQTKDRMNPENDNKKAEGKGSETKYTPPRRKRRLIRTEQYYHMQLRPDRELMKKRFGLAEHPFGTMKVALRRDVYNLRGMKYVEGEQALTCLAYDMRIAYHAFGFNKLMELIKNNYQKDPLCRKISETN